MTPRLYVQNYKLIKIPLSINFQRRLEHKVNKRNKRTFSIKARIHVRILTDIECGLLI